MSDNTILLSFDVEEFDMPLEYGQNISPEVQMQTGYAGVEVLVKLLEPFQLKATYFTTGNFASHYPAAIKELGQQNEIASHTFYHSTFQNEDLLSSKQMLEDISGKKVSGLRMPRMRQVDLDEVVKAGYTYDSSIHPTWLPGRYNNLHLSRTPYVEQGLLRVPASVSPHLRLPLFWLAFKNYPYPLFLQLAKQTLKNDGYLCLYFHPWEFVNLDQFSLPGYTKRYAGKVLQDRLIRLITNLSAYGKYDTMENYIANNYLQQSI